MGLLHKFEIKRIEACGFYINNMKSFKLHEHVYKALYCKYCFFDYVDMGRL